jgi:hypothetical protein
MRCEVWWDRSRKQGSRLEATAKQEKHNGIRRSRSHAPRTIQGADIIRPATPYRLGDDFWSHRGGQRRTLQLFQRVLRRSAAMHVRCQSAPGRPGEGHRGEYLRSPARRAGVPISRSGSPKRSPGSAGMNCFLKATPASAHSFPFALNPTQTRLVDMPSTLKRPFTSNRSYVGVEK